VREGIGGGPEEALRYPRRPMIDEVTAARDDALRQVAAVASVAELATLQPQVLGRKGRLADVKQRLGGLPPEDRRIVGQALNDATATVTAALEERRTALAAGERAARLEAERLDLTEITTRPTRGHRHLVTQATEHLEDVFVGLGFMIAEGPEVETDVNNFTALNMPPWHPARSDFDTMYVDLGEPGSVMLRTHTSPVQIRVMRSQPPPIRIVAPGRVYRRDTPDATHMPVFHQVEGLVVDRGITFPDLAGTIEAFTHAYFGPGFTSRLRPSHFPFTEPSAEFDIQRPDGSWLELGGCGMVHPAVFEACGIDPEEWTGFAFGFGIDRMPLMRHGIDDLRELFTNDVRFLGQF
jgi:phenylalanyl-tRNA synthetase alpha chain